MYDHYLDYPQKGYSVMDTLKRTAVVVVKDIKTDRIVRKRLHTFLSSPGVTCLHATVEQHIASKSTRLINDRYIVGLDQAEVAARLPRFFIGVCVYKVLKKNHLKSRSFRSKTAAARYSTGSVTEFMDTVSNILHSQGGSPVGMTPSGDQITIRPPVPVAGSYYITMADTVGATIDHLWRLRNEAQDLVHKANTGEDGYMFYELRLRVGRMTVHPVYCYDNTHGSVAGPLPPNTVSVRTIVPGRDVEDALANFRKCLVYDKGMLFQASPIGSIEMPMSHILIRSGGGYPLNAKSKGVNHVATH